MPNRTAKWRVSRTIALEDDESEQRDEIDETRASGRPRGSASRRFTTLNDCRRPISAKDHTTSISHDVYRVLIDARPAKLLSVA